MRRSGIKIMGQLIGLVKPLWYMMGAAVILGVTGYLCAISLTVLACAGILSAMGIWNGISLPVFFAVIGIAAACRGILHYGEQACNHFIAFKLLALIRHKVFMALRRLCPAKLDGKEKGNLISIITTDIELLEVFYAHTISPIMIAIVTSVIMEIFFFHFHPAAGILSACGYLMVGVAVPVRNSKKGSEKGMNFRTEFGNMNSFMLDSLRGLDEIIQFGSGEERLERMERMGRRLDERQKEMKKLEGTQRGTTSILIVLFSFCMLFLTVLLYQKGELSFTGVLLCTVLMMGSFGPVVALSSLSNNLMQTLASGERVLALLEEQPEIREITDREKTEFDTVFCDRLDFSYEEENILNGYSIRIPKGSRVGIHGKSGSGKSTFLKLLMRFYDVDNGMIHIGEKEIRQINTKDLRNMESYVTQETCLFHDSIANNIAVAKPGASRAEIEEAAKKASLHEFVMSLPDGYDTPVGELGDTLSGGERQRIGIARAFLHNAPLLLLDEPTSNLDSLNESIILRSLKEKCQEKTLILVSHRESTMAVAEQVYEMENGRTAT